LGVTDALLAKSDVAASARLHLRSRTVPVGIDQLDLPGTAFPHLLLIRQADVEAVLSAALSARGVTVERGAELVGIRPGKSRRAIVRHNESEEQIEEIPYRYLAGCDGAGSLVRDRVGAWHGGDYAQEVVLADLELRGTGTAGTAGGSGTATGDANAGGLEPGTAHVVAGRRGLLFLFAIGERATWRMLATRRARESQLPFGQPGPAVPRAELQALVDDAGLPAEVTDVAWSAPLRLQHRLATHFRRGPLFLAGDAAHVHSPAGGQGMNTGIQDALNLGWKLAFAAGSEHVGAGRPRTELLGSYERERRPADRRVLWATHAIFWAEASLHPLAQLGRSVLVPLGAPLVPWLTRQRPLVARGAGMLSRFGLHYRRSPLSIEATTPGPARRSVRGPRAGSRLPDAQVTCEGRRVRLHALIAEPGVHVLLQRDADAVDERLLGPRIHVHRLTDRPGRGVAIIRPDGYIGFRAAVVDQGQVGDWLRLVGLAPRRAVQAVSAQV
jgi:2-polyprenyl-6-methoxyphenol hydroxylase-like FAD-dependent oxidoreductase